jgi:PRTRC genetic system ThiF family protein
MTYNVSLERMRGMPAIIVVGTGGTGGFVAEGLCRLLAGYKIQLIFVDPDRIETPNLIRQNFYVADLGKFKAQVLAERLSRQYCMKIGYSVMPYEKDTFRRISNQIIIGCVDGPDARRSILESMDWQKWWIDSGNGFNSGQVLIGNTTEKDKLAEAFDSNEELVRMLPVPSLQQPALLAPIPKIIRPVDCAEAIQNQDQSPTINQAMAVLVLDMVNHLLRETLNYMGVYLDMEAGTMHRVPATPKVVARMMSMKQGFLMANQCALGGRYHIPQGAYLQRRNPEGDNDDDE